MIKRIYKVAAAVFAGIMLLLTVAIYVVYQDYLLFLSSPVSSVQWPLHIEVKPGTHFNHLANDLYERGVIRNKNYLRWYARSENIAQRIKAGRYRFDKAVTPVDLLDKIVKNDLAFQEPSLLIEGDCIWEEGDDADTDTFKPNLLKKLEELPCGGIQVVWTKG